MRILLVEDEDDVRQFFTRALGHLVPDAEIVQAVDGRQALDIFQAEPFDLVLSDHRMPNATGVELLQRIRATSQVPFVLITADRSVDSAALAAGVNDILSKPISLDALRAAIARYIPG